MSELQTVGKSIHRKEGVSKVTGQAIYADDIRRDNCVYGKTIRSKVAHGFIKRISFLEGMPWQEFTVVLPADIPGLNGVTLIDATQPFLAASEIQHIAEIRRLLSHHGFLWPPSGHRGRRKVGTQLAYFQRTIRRCKGIPHGFIIFVGTLGTQIGASKILSASLTG